MQHNCKKNVKPTNYTSYMKKLTLILILISLTKLFVFSQTDTAFWFAVPFATRGHVIPGAYLRFTAVDQQGATITVTQPGSSTPMTPRTVYVPGGKQIYVF